MMLYLFITTICINVEIQHCRGFARRTHCDDSLLQIMYNECNECGVDVERGDYEHQAIVSRIAPENATRSITFVK